MSRSVALVVAGATLSIFALARSAPCEEPAPVKLRVALFPYVPRAAAFEDAIKRAWVADEQHKKVPLEFIHGWDCYSQDPFEDCDVFECDAILLDYFVKNGFAQPLGLEEVRELDDIFPFALRGSMVDGVVYGVPRLSCGNFLFYRDGDADLASAKSLSDIHKCVGDASENADVFPKDGKGLFIDLTGRTSCSCFYLDGVADTSQDYDVTPELPKADALDGSVLKTLRQLVTMSGKAQATYKDPTDPKQVSDTRAGRFAAGYGRAYVGYSERLSRMPIATHEKIHVRELPLGLTNAVNLLFIDTLCVKSTLHGERRKLAVELANICASRETVLEGLMPTDSEPAQYLLPARMSVLNDTQLRAKAPRYDELAAIMNHAPRAFRCGPDVRRWVSRNGESIRSALQTAK